MKHTLYIVLISAFFAVLTACSHDMVYSQFYPIPSEKWHVDTVPSFDYTIADTTISYRIMVYIRHTERYPYQNMWLFIENNHRCDTIEFYLADDRGRWLGDKHQGIMEMPVLFEENKHFNDTGVYRLSIHQAMRDTLLRGVTDVGVEVLKIER